MKFRDIELRMAPVQIGVLLFFAIFLILAFLMSGSSTILVFGIPMILGLAGIPIVLRHMSQSQYESLIPTYEREAQKVRIKAINMNMLGKPVRVEGVVERVSFGFLDRPQFLVADRSGEISVKMFTAPHEKIRKDDVVDVLGTVMKRYLLVGEDPVINCVSIRKVSGGKPDKKT
ncbi:MAG TPA: nucleotide-binding protein [Methanomicrobiales archaeon]|nr:nucleotide-binding protein [Methanomicrobiales archaeon]HVN65740.1 nucleotide-binding protein [Methanomicrobiales archaeon]